MAESQPLRADFGDDGDDGDRDWDSSERVPRNRTRNRPIRPYSLKSVFSLAACLYVMASITAYMLMSGISSLPSPSEPDADAFAPNTTRLVMGRDAKTFKIAIFSDLHFGEQESGWGVEQDRKSTGLMGAILDEEEPDMVVLNGDLITGENTLKENSSAYVDQVVHPMEQRNVPWASTYGNHDSQFNLSREHIYGAEKRHSLSLTRRMGPPGAGVTNYYLLIQRAVGDHEGRDDRNDGGGHDNHDDHDDQHRSDLEPLAVLWFFDSRGGIAYQKQHEDIDSWVAPEATEWFMETSVKLRERHEKQLPSLAFVHIPPRVFRTASTSVDPALFPGLNDDESPLPIQGSNADAELFVHTLGSVRGLHSVYAGHDHGSAWCATWPGDSAMGRRTNRADERSEPHGRPGRIAKRHGDEDGEDEEMESGREDAAGLGHKPGQGGEVEKPKSTGKRTPFLCFSRHTGYGGYGTWKRGARILELSFDDVGGGDSQQHEDKDKIAQDPKLAVETWVRMEGGHVFTRVALNETYGSDRYPTANRE